ncbi:MAG TPA: carboxypeptidase-like regulatory domain-containing protein, partial [Bryobacteraceae bacterium]|nr:carboxypeptidase-like regulatory domain-containing protein [Bryobacteraceae bacterium]
MLSILCRAVSVVALCCAMALAQTSTGQIAVTVFDSSGAVVPGAVVTLSGSETGEVVRTLTADENGSAFAPLLRPGAYTVSVAAPGFKKLE